jgi:DMSO/TMAO reductase YedYZ molybdopterin-dependent catalytic subunit
MINGKLLLPRRRFLTGAALGTGGLLLSGCDMLTENESFRSVLRSGEALNKTAQRLISDRAALAREFSESDISPVFKANGSISGATPEYAAHVADKFVRWQLKIDGLVRNPLSLSLTQLMAMPSREQITRHDCVEGWSAIGKWRGTPLGMLLKQAGLSTKARYVVFHCADQWGPAVPYYESVDLIDAFHPQTILAWSMNGQALPVKHGAPLRLRVERQLGYKQAKYVMRIEATDDLTKFYKGKGGYWEDAHDYDWYAGI